MSWVKDCLQQERASVSNAEPPREVLAQSIPEWNDVWHRIHEVIMADVLEFNNNSRRQFDFSSDPGFIQVIPKQPPLDTVVLQIDPHRRHAVDLSHLSSGGAAKGTFQARAGLHRVLAQFPRTTSAAR